jgi:hypothetical protein
MTISMIGTDHRDSRARMRARAGARICCARRVALRKNWQEDIWFAPLHPRLDLGAKLDRRPRPKRDEDQQHNCLGRDERELRLRRRQRLEEGQLQERLHDPDEDIQLNQLASQQAAKGDGLLRSYQPRTAAAQAIDIRPIWHARTDETLQQALDTAQGAILSALQSNDFETRLKAAKLMLKTRQARARGLT